MIAPASAGGLDWVRSLFSTTTEIAQTLSTPEPISPPDLSYYVLGQSVELVWSEVPEATAYLVTLVAPFVINASYTVSTTRLLLPASTLSAPETYTWRVRAVNRNGQSPLSPVRRFIILLHPFTPTPTPTPTPTANIDLNGDGFIDFRDTFTITSDWQDESAAGDLTGDLRVEEQDMISYLAAWPARGIPTPTPLLPPPVLLEPTDGAVINFDDIVYVAQKVYSIPSPGNSVIFRWAQARTGNLYDLRFEGPPGSSISEYVLRNLTDTQVHVVLPLRLDNPKDLGIYRWQVRVGDSGSGLYGRYSDPFTFRVVRIVISPTPTPTRTPFPDRGDGDANLDGAITGGDIFLFASSWQRQSFQSGYLRNADLDSSGKVDERDFHQLLRSFQNREEEALSAPVLLSPTDGARLLLSDVSGGNYVWNFQAVPGAAIYEWEVIQPPPLSRVGDFIVESGQSAYNVPISSFALRRVGLWKWRVRAFGPSGRVSPWSPQYSFQVVSSL